MDLSNLKSEIDSLRTKAKALDTIAKALETGDLPDPKRITYLNTKLAKYILSYEVFTLEDVRTIIGQIWNSRTADVLPLSLCKDGTYKFLTPYHGRSGDITPVFPVTVDVSKWGIEFKFYVLIEDDIVSVSIKMPEGFKAYAQVRYTQRQAWHHIKRVSLEHSAFENPNYLCFSSGSPITPPTYTLYWENANSLDDIFTEWAK